MFKKLIVSCAAVATMLTLAPSAALSATYLFDSGTVAITAVLSGTTTSVLQPGTSPITVALGGSFVDFDASMGANGTVTGLELIPAGTFTIDLDETVVGLNLIDVSMAALTQQAGAMGVVSGGGSFFIDTAISAFITPPGVPITSLTSAASGLMGLSGSTLSLGLFGINIAQFESLTTPGTFIDVKADFNFVGTIVPEPTAALLLGLGLLGLASVKGERA